MNIRVERLRATLKLIGPAVPNKPTLPILKNVLLGEGKAVATNFENTIVIDFQEAAEPCLLPYREVSELLSITPGNQYLSLETVKGTVKLAWPGGKASYPVAKITEFPDAGNKPVPELMGDVDGNAMVDGLTEMAPYAATDGARPVLNGVTLYMGEKTALAAADSFRLVYRVLPFSFGEKGTVIIPLETVKLLGGLWKNTPLVAQTKGSLIERLMAKKMLTLAVGVEKEKPAWIGFKFGITKLLSQVIVGDPPDHKALIEVKPDITVSALASELLLAVNRTKEVATAGSGIVRLRWDENGLEVYSTSVEIGEVSTTIPTLAMDGPGRIAVNYRYLTEYLKGKEGKVTIGMKSSGSSPILFEYSNSPITVIMPMMVQW